MQRNYFFDARKLCAKALLIATGLIFTLVSSQHVSADFGFADADGNQIIGFDTDPDGGFDNAGGGNTGDLVVGVNDLGGIEGDDQLIFGGVDPLLSTSGIIGQEVTGIGAVTLNGVISAWDISGDLTVGDAGQGIVFLGTSGTIDVEEDTIIGDDGTGFGLVEINGTTSPGARLRTMGMLTIGNAGHGRVELTDRGNLFSDGQAVVGSLDGGTGEVFITDAGSRWFVNDLVIGNGLSNTTTANGTVEVSNDGLLQVAAVTTVNPLGELTFLGGVLRSTSADALTANAVINSGLIRGDGLIDAGITIAPAGVLSNAAAGVVNGPTVTNLRESLRVSGEVINNGRIESDGGEMIFDSLVTNNDNLIARDAIIDFRNTAPEDGTTDLLNNAGGLIVVGGDVSLTGDIDNSGGDFFTLDNTTLLVTGTLTFSSGIFGMALNGEAPPVTVTGEADLSGATIDLELSSGFTPEIGVPIELLQAQDGLTFAGGVDAAGGLIFDIFAIGNTLFASTAGVPIMPMSSDFNGDGIVNALDLQIWEDNFGLSGVLQPMGDADGDGDVDGMDFFLIQRDFGGPPLPPLSALATVPEPSTLVMALLALVGCPRRRG